ncbi:uncharacterized protein LOC105854958 [Microcebus murinus]|uniref:uncharacterized protein LOC105854958 n=1 Tax=Microcebus murinus TaxID=30608 RepID=UPI0006429455|nr:uncharacterized protein LOC105854958 [Microcebus murinus]
MGVRLAEPAIVRRAGKAGRDWLNSSVPRRSLQSPTHPGGQGRGRNPKGSALEPRRERGEGVDKAPRAARRALVQPGRRPSLGTRGARRPVRARPRGLRRAPGRSSRAPARRPESRGPAADPRPEAAAPLGLRSCWQGGLK